MLAASAGAPDCPARAETRLKQAIATNRERRIREASGNGDLTTSPAVRLDAFSGKTYHPEIKMFNFSLISGETLLGRTLRSPLRLVPSGAVFPILQGPLRGKKWIVGSC